MLTVDETHATKVISLVLRYFVLFSSMRAELTTGSVRPASQWALATEGCEKIMQQSLTTSHHIGKSGKRKQKTIQSNRKKQITQMIFTPGKHWWRNQNNGQRTFKKKTTQPSPQ
jgi:hypothetical protein